MGDQEIRRVQQVSQLGPKFSKGRAVTDIVPGQAMDVSENKFLSRWPDEPMVPFYNAIVLDMHDADRTSAVGVVVCRFEINCREICHAPRAVAPSRLAVTTAWSDLDRKSLQVLWSGVAPDSS